MAAPTAYTLEVAFSTDPLAVTPTWTDVSAYLISATIRRGRNRELDRIEGSSATFVLDNNDRRFDPSYAGTPYYPDVIPMRKVRLSVTHAGSTRYVFTGYVDGWPQSWDLPNYTEAPITASDGLKVCSLYDLSSSLTAAASGTQIGAILDQVGWPSADRTVDTGQSTVQALTVAAGDEVSALSRIQDVADTELGIFFIDGQGRAVFHDRHKRLKTPYTVSNGTFGDDPATEIPYAYLQPDYDEQEIKNDVRLTPAGAATQTASDATSQASYGKRTYTKATIHQTVSEALDQAYFIVSKYKNPSLRFNAIRLEPLDSSALWAQVLDRELGDRITVVRRPPGGGTVTQDCHIESVQHEIGAGLLGWTTTWGLSSADETTYWVLGDSVNSLLGSTTTLAY